MKKLNKKGVVELSKTTSLIILIVFGLIFGYFAIKIGFYVAGSYLGEESKETIIYCKDGTEKVWDGAGVYCGVYADSIVSIEKIIKDSNNNNINTDFLIIK